MHSESTSQGNSSNFSTLRLDSTYGGGGETTVEDFSDSLSISYEPIKLKPHQKNNARPSNKKDNVIRKTQGPNGSLHMSQVGKQKLAKHIKSHSVAPPPPAYNIPGSPYPQYVPQQVMQPMYVQPGYNQPGYNQPGYNHPIMVKTPEGYGTPYIVQQPDGNFALQYPQEPQKKSPVPSRSTRNGRSKSVSKAGGGRSKSGTRAKRQAFHERKNTIEHEGTEERRKIVLARIIHMLSYGNNQWILLSEKIDDNIIGHQTLWTKKIKSGQSPPSKIINSLRDKGHNIRQVNYGQGRWVVVADFLGPAVHRWKQKYSFTRDFPGTDIRKAWHDGHRVSYLNYCDKLWVLIIEQNAEVRSAGQRLVVRNKLPKKDVDEFWHEGRDIHVMTYGEDQWVLIGEMTLGDTTQTQTFYYSTDFPHEKIQEYYRQDRRIHTVCYARKEKLWALITENKAKGNSQFMYSDSSFPQEQLKKLKFT